MVRENSCFDLVFWLVTSRHTTWKTKLYGWARLSLKSVTFEVSLKKEEGGRQSSLAFWLSLWCLLRSGVCGITGSYCKHHFMVATVFFFLFNSYDYHTFTNGHSLLLCISSSFSFPPFFFLFWKIPRRFGSWRFTWLKSLITALWRLFPITLRENV